jgi:hypothetical protein
MDAQDIRSLSEAYMNVQQLDEAEGSYGSKGSAAYTSCFWERVKLNHL